MFLALKPGLDGVAEASSQEEQTVADYEKLNHAPVDLYGPTVRIGFPTTDTKIHTGSTLVIVATATDNVAVVSVVVSFDLDGDGVQGPGEESKAVALGFDTFAVALGRVAGASGSRVIRVIATDPGGNLNRATMKVRIR